MFSNSMFFGDFNPSASIVLRLENMTDWTGLNSILTPDPTTPETDYFTIEQTKGSQGDMCCGLNGT